MKGQLGQPAGQREEEQEQEEQLAYRELEPEHEDEPGRAKLGMPNTEQEIARPCKMPARNSMTGQ